MGLLELLLLSVSLAMDAFAVSICGSMLLTPADRTAGALRFGIWFGFFSIPDAHHRLFWRDFVY